MAAKVRSKGKPKRDPVAAALGGPIKDRRGKVGDLKSLPKARQPRGASRAPNLSADLLKISETMAAKSGDKKAAAKIRTARKTVERKPTPYKLKPVPESKRKSLSDSRREQSGPGDLLDTLEDVGKGTLKVGGKIVKDIRDTVINAPSDFYEIGASGYESVVKGDNTRRDRIIKGFREHDPIILGLRGKFKEAGKAIEEHPGNFLLELGGLKGGAGRGTTRVQRAAGKKMPTRAPGRVPGTNLEKPRPYSQDAINRAVQVKRETKRTKVATDLRKQADELERLDPVANRHDIVASREKADRVDPTRLKPSYAKKRAARRASLDQAIAERHAADAQKAYRMEVAGALSTGKTRVTRKPSTKTSPNAAVNLAAQDVARTPAELAAYRKQIADNFENLTPSERVEARTTLDEIDKALKETDWSKVDTAAEGYGRVMKPIQEGLHEAGVLAPDQTAKAALTPYSVTHHPDVVPGSARPKRAGGGAKVTLAEMRARRAEHRGPDAPDPAWVSNRRASAGGVRSGGRLLAAPKPGGGPRGGGAIKAGTADVSGHAMSRSIGQAQKLLDSHHAYQRRIAEGSVPLPGGENMSRKRALAAAKDLSAEHGHEFIVVPENPLAGNKRVQELLNDDPESLNTQRTLSEVLEDAYSGNSEVPGNYRVVPAAYAKELSAQATKYVPEGLAGASMRAVSSTFRRTVLSTSVPWATGNAVEGVVRSLMAGVRPGDYKLAAKHLDELDRIDPLAAENLRALVRGGGHYSSSDAFMRQRGQLLQYLSENGPTQQRFAESMAKAAANPVPARVVKAWDDYTHFIFNQVNGRMESKVRLGMAGKAMREMGLIDPRALKLSHDAVSDGARGLKDTNAQAALGEELGKMYGRYDGYTSGTRYMILNYTPFAAWFLNAGRFVLHTLPTEHPTFVAVSSMLQNAERDMQDADVPDWLKGTISVAGGHINLARYTPFGWAQDVGGSAGDLVLPQFSGAFDMLRHGQDWKGKKLREEDGDPIGQGERAQRAIAAFLLGTVPVLNKALQTAKNPAAAINPVRTIPNAPPRSGGGGAPKAYDPLGGYDAGSTGGVSDPTLPGATGAGPAYDPLAGYSGN